MKAVMIVLAIALGILWIAGLSAGASGWLVWLDFVGALWALGAGIAPDRRGTLSNGSAFAIGVGLLVLWIIGLGVHATIWMAWWTFAFGVAFIIAGAVGARSTSAIGRPSHA